jgi:hypothetical protein
MTPAMIKLLIAFGIEMSTKGIPAGIRLIQGLRTDDPTEDQIDRLHNLVKPPDSYERRGPQ